MCFSATASFSAGAVLLGPGTLTLRSAMAKHQRRALPFAAIPLLFAIQQPIEGVIWLTFIYEAALLNSVMTHVYSFFTHVLWPVYVSAHRSRGHECCPFATKATVLSSPQWIASLRTLTITRDCPHAWPNPLGRWEEVGWRPNSTKVGDKRSDRGSVCRGESLVSSFRSRRSWWSAILPAARSGKPPARPDFS
jgi:hypothetical protein